MKEELGKEATSMLFLASVLTLFFSAIVVLAFSGDIIIASGGSTPTIDGVLEDGEWDDASTITISVTDGANCTVYAKQDGVNLYVGFSVLDVTYNDGDRCVVIFDINHDGGTSLQTDDMWLAVSRNGAEEEYNVTAVPLPPGWYPTTVSSWTAKSNSTSSAWQLEYNITYSKLDITAGTGKTLGVTFLIVDKDVMGYYMWPRTASYLEPVTWGDMTSNGYNWVPEFSTWASMLLLLIVLAVAIAMCKRRLLETPFH